MAKILIIDATGVSLDFAIRCMSFDHDVKVFIRNNLDGARSQIGDGGLLNRVSDWERHMNWADLIFCTDNIFYIHALERYRDKGYPIFGPSVDTTRWEMDREHGAAVMESVGIKTIPSQKFSSYDDAIEFVVKNNKRYVSKPLGDGNKAMSYVSKSPADMVFMLQKWKKSNAYKGEFILQEFHGGIEIAVGGWFGPGGFCKHWCVNHEFKKLLSGDLGVSTGEECSLIYYSQQSKLADEVLVPLAGMLKGLR
jgi:phosphoribosylamine--glycine ligase